jgi:hypothetical protein
VRRAVPAVALALALAVPAATFGIPRTVDAFDAGDAAVAGDSPVGLVVPRACDDCGVPERSSARRAERQAPSPAPARPPPARAAGGKDAVPAAPPPAAPAVETPRPPVAPASTPRPAPQPKRDANGRSPQVPADVTHEADEPPRQDPAADAPAREAVEEPPAEPAPTPLAIRVVRVTPSSPFSATVVWRTSLPARTRIAYGPAGGTPSVWTRSEAPEFEHETTVHGLSFGTDYKLTLLAEDEFDRSTDATVEVTTPPLRERTRATTVDGVVLLDGEPFFPRMVWAQCAEGYEANLAVGVNTFMGNDCEPGAEQLARLDGRAFSITPAGYSGEGTGLIGSHLPDEWDRQMPGELTLSALERLIPPTVEHGVSFLTLTSHFYSNAEPLPEGRGMYPALIAAADVVGFDLYPLQSWCRREGFRHVYAAQRELVAAGGGKPTYQWIEVRDFDCHSDPSLSVTRETVRAETWLAIAGGAHGIGYFPHNWAASVGEEIARLNSEIDALAPALLEPVTEAAVTPGGAVEASFRRHNGALYIIAVNTTRQPVTATIAVPGLGNRTLLPVGDGAEVRAAQEAFSESFDPLGVRVYVAAPETT